MFKLKSLKEQNDAAAAAAAASGTTGKKVFHFILHAYTYLYSPMPDVDHGSGASSTERSVHLT